VGYSVYSAPADDDSMVPMGVADWLPVGIGIVAIGVFNLLIRQSLRINIADRRFYWRQSWIAPLREYSGNLDDCHFVLEEGTMSDGVTVSFRTPNNRLFVPIASLDTEVAHNMAAQLQADLRIPVLTGSHSILLNRQLAFPALEVPPPSTVLAESEIELRIGPPHSRYPVASFPLAVIGLLSLFSMLVSPVLMPFKIFDSAVRGPWLVAFVLCIVASLAPSVQDLLMGRQNTVFECENGVVEVRTERPSGHVRVHTVCRLNWSRKFLYRHSRFSIFRSVVGLDDAGRTCQFLSGYDEATIRYATNWLTGRTIASRRSPKGSPPPVIRKPFTFRSRTLWP